MIGLNAAAVSDTFPVDANAVPVMMVTVRYLRRSNWPITPRTLVEEVLAFA